MKVKCYRTTRYKATDTYDVERIGGMPEPDDLTFEDIRDADGLMLTLYLKDNSVIFIPHHFIISIEED